MTTAAGRDTVAYIVKCALPAGDSLVKQDQDGTSYTFSGGLGICPAWKNGGIAGNAQCVEGISACVMAHLNTAGVHVPLWLDSPISSIGWGVDRFDYPMQEGTFFGDIFDAGSRSGIGKPGLTGPLAYYCDGAGFPAGADGVVAGRLGANQANAPYKNPFGVGALCQTAPGTTPQYSKGVIGSCPPQVTNPPASGCPDGYSTIQANGGVWNYPITVWRNNHYRPQFDTGYQYTLSPSSAPSQVLDTGTSAPIQIWNASADLPSSAFTLAPSGGGWTIAPLANPALCLDAGSGAPGAGVDLVSCNGSPGQSFTITPDAQSGDFFLKAANTGRCVQIRSGATAPGSAVEVADCAGTAGQKFDIHASTFAPADGAQFNFEQGAQGWTLSGSPGIGLAATNVVSFAGDQSLAIGMNGPAGAVFAFATSPVPPAGAVVTFNFYVPPASPIRGVQPFVQQGPAGNWAWTGNYQPIGNLKPGAWNRLELQVPAQAQPLWRVGFFVATGWTGAATVYVDSIAW